MLKNRSELEIFLRKKCESIVFDVEECEMVRDYMFDKYNVSTGTTMDMIARGIIGHQSEFVLFCLLDGIDYVYNKNYKKEFFTDIEINQYSTEKVEQDGIKFPIRIKCVQVDECQWIGATDTKFFMTLRKAQLVKYNANAQRVMKRIIKNESVTFKIVPNKLAISSIRKLMQSKMYIPTTITLNIPYDSDAKFYYDEKSNELVIEELEAFDISDGYHRFLAMCEENDENVKFNYPMEIRIINFTDEKTRQFIYQEDQKTKMAKSSSDAMNINRHSNNVLDRLNEMPTFELKGLIGLNEGIINYASLSNVIEYFYFKEKKTYTSLDVRNARDDIKEKLNMLVEYNNKCLSKGWTMIEMVLIFYVFSIENDLPKACKIIDEAINNNVLKDVVCKKLTKPLLNTIHQKLEEGGLYV